MFQIAAVPFDDYDALDVADGPRWLLVRLARFADRDGRCFPSMRTLAAGAKKSLATVCRWLKKLERAGCFTRSRKAGARYVYVLAEAYRLRWRDKPKPSVSPPQSGVSQHAKQEADSPKHEDMKWRSRLRRLRDHGLWVASFGPLPGEPGCRVPTAFLEHMQRPVEGAKASAV